MYVERYVASHSRLIDVTLKRPLIKTVNIQTYMQDVFLCTLVKTSIYSPYGYGTSHGWESNPQRTSSELFKRGKTLKVDLIDFQLCRRVFCKLFSQNFVHLVVFTPGGRVCKANSFPLLLSRFICSQQKRVIKKLNVSKSSAFSR